MKNNCKVCGKEFYIKPSWIKRGRGFYCSRKCYYKSDTYLIQRPRNLTTVGFIKRNCLYCGKEILVAKCLSQRKKYCSRQCKGKNLPIGEKAFNWKGGITPKHQKIRQSIELRLWREAVFSRDNWTCQKCKKRGETLNAHHIKPFAKFPELRVALDNGITLCKKCHYREPNGRKINVLYK